MRDLEPESTEIGANETLKIAKMDRIQKAYQKKGALPAGRPRSFTGRKGNLALGLQQPFSGKRV